MLKVFLGGEGKNDIGTRCDRPMGDQPGVVETLLRRVRASGWHVAGARSWRLIRKYRAGAARKRADHDDVHNVLGLVLEAYENACEMLVFVRDRDREELREQAIRRVLETIATFGFAEEYRYELAIVGGVPKPKLEGWILCLLGVAGTDRMTTARVDREVASLPVVAKSTEHYVAIAESATLPPPEGSLANWLAHADETFRRLIDGVDAG
jgi:hypothetical protein